MSEPNVPPLSKAPAKAGKSLASSLKGHPPWVYAVVIAGAVAMAWYIRSRQNAAAEAAALSGPDGSATPVDGYATAGYDTSAYPGATQGASYWGSTTPGDENGSTLPGTLTFDQLGALLSMWPAAQQPVGGGGGGAPTLPDQVHYPPTPEITPQPDAPPVYQPPPPPPATPVPHAVASGPQPISAPNVFYNAQRNLRYIVQKTNGKNYRRYESKLNKGDWGQGGVIPQ